MSLLENIVLSWFDWFAYMLIIHNLIELNIRSKAILFAIVGSCISGFVSYAFNENLATIVIAIIIFVFIKLLLRRSFINTLGIYAISTIMIIAIQGLLLTISLLIVEPHDIFTIGVIIQLVEIGLIFLILRIISLNTLYRFILHRNRTFLFLVLNLFILSFALMLFWHFNRYEFIERFIIIAVIFVVIITINFVILKNGLKNKAYEDEVRTYRLYAPMIENLFDELKTEQHEFNNQIQAIKMNLKIHEENDEVIQAIEHIIQSNSIGKLAKLHNKLISGLIYSKIILAKDRDILFEVILKTYMIDTSMKEYEVVEIIGILLDNAFETEVENNTVYLEIREEKDMSVIQVMNKHPYLTKKKQECFFEKGNSSKGSNRGYGLCRLNQICKKYGADVILSNITLDGDNYVSFQVRMKITI